MPAFQSRRYIFTINNPTQVDLDHVAALGLDALRKYLVIGREVGEQGTPHLQGFVIFTRPLSRQRVKAFLPRAFFEAARGTSDQAATYCKKDGDYDEFGQCPRQEGANGVLQPVYDWADDFMATHLRAPTSPEIARAHRTAYLRYPRITRLFEHQAPPARLRQGEPNEWQQSLNEELSGTPDDRTIIFYVDPLGGNGKSWFQGWYVSEHPDTTQLLSIGKRDDIAHTIDVSKKVFFFNVPRGGMEHLQYTILEQLKDRVIFSPKYNSRTKFLHNVPHVVVFCNEAPDLNKMSQDRFDIRADF